MGEPTFFFQVCSSREGEGGAVAKGFWRLKENNVGAID